MIRLFLLLILTGAALAETIKDNSFFLEEAYNQKPGEYQFIQRYKSFKQNTEYYLRSELQAPLGSEKHQLSLEATREKDDVDHAGPPFWNYRSNRQFEKILPTE